LAQLSIHTISAALQDALFDKDLIEDFFTIQTPCSRAQGELAERLSW